MTKVTYETRDGRPVELLTTSYRVAPQEIRLLGLVKDTNGDLLRVWYRDGSVLGRDMPHNLDLFRVTVAPRYVRLNARNPHREGIFDIEVEIDPTLGDELHEIYIDDRRQYSHEDHS